MLTSGVPPGASSVPGAAVTGTTTRVVRFRAMVLEEDIGEDETWEDFLEDVKLGTILLSRDA